MTQKPLLTPVSALGEFGLIDLLTSDIELKNVSSLQGVGDDAAILRYSDGTILVSTDLLIEGVHFDLAYTPLKHLGYKAAIVNFSDIAAMNAIPRQITFSLALSSRFSVEAIQEIYQGVKQACNSYGVDLVGGDTSASTSGLIISVTVLGEPGAGNIALRSGARVNDLICVSGDLGAAYLGLLILKREKKVFQVNPNMQPDLKGYDYILQRQLKPEARTDIITLLAEKHINPTSMIDISDGLASEILHICKQSKVGARIYEDKIPVDILTEKFASELNIHPITCAMNGGEDYELLFTIAPDDYEKIKEIDSISVIGHITEFSDGANLVLSSGELSTIKAQGWDGLKDFA